jgi:hypothetical protein
MDLAERGRNRRSCQGNVRDDDACRQGRVGLQTAKLPVVKFEKLERPKLKAWKADPKFALSSVISFGPVAIFL